MRGATRARSLLVGIAVVAAALGVGASPASAANGTVQGTVTSSALGGPLPGVEVRAYDTLFGVVAGITTTDAAGGWTMSVGAGNYRLRFDAPSGAYERIYSGASPTWIGSSVVNVPSGGTTVSDIAMHPTTGVVGTITDSATNPIAGVQVIALHPVYGSVLTSVTTDTSGRYELPIEPVVIRIRATDPTHVRGDVYSGGATAWPASSTFTVTSPGPDTFDAVLPTVPVIQGTVLATGGGPLGGIVVDALASDGTKVGSTTTAPDGTYSMAATIGTLIVRFSDPTGARATLYSGGSATRAGATTVDGLGGSTSIVDIALPVAGHLTGSASVGSSDLVPQTVIVVALESSTSEISGLAIVGTNGTWNMAGLPAGSFKVGYVDVQTLLGTAQLGYRPVTVPSHDIDWEGIGSAIANATSFAVTSGATTPTPAQPLVGWDCWPLVHGQTNAQLSGANLRGCTFLPDDLTGADLTGADLTGADLGGADLAGTDLAGANLTAADLTGAFLAVSNFTDADLTDAVLDSAFTSYGQVSGMTTLHANFTGATIRGASFRNAYVSFGNPSQQMMDADPDWTGVDFTGAVDLTYDVPCGCTLAKPTGPFGYTFSDWTAKTFSPGLGVTLHGSPYQFSGATFPKGFIGDLAGADLSGWTCTNCTFANFGAGMLPPLNVPADWTGVNLTGANLTGSSIIAGTNLTNANLTGLTGNPKGGSGLVYANTTCPDGVVTDGTTVATCVGHGLAS